MILNQSHAEEIFWLERRKLFLRIMNELAENDADKDAFFTYAEYFAKVSSPEAFMNRIKEAYDNEKQEKESHS